MKNLDKKHLWIIGAWFIINLLQSIFTGLHSDESYYWMYSENIDFGFFDHPPMVAILIYLGHAVLPGEIGVRLFFILMSTTTFALILNELNAKKDYFFLTIFVLSFPLIHTHISGFIALPDIPLLFFTVLFLILYRKFIEKPGLILSVWLGLVCSAMIYSKYHAFVVIGLTVFSNLKLLKNKYFYVVAAVALVTLLPHIFWQIQNDFPTFKYHLIERAKPLRLKYVGSYLISVLAVAGPLTGVLVFWKLIKFKPINPFQKTLIFNIIGFYLLFFILSFKNRIEAHWVSAIIPMLMILTFPLINSDTKIKTWFIRLALPVIILLLVFRVFIAVDSIPNWGGIKNTFYKREAHAREIENMAKGRKVGFFNNYAATSNYIFYTGNRAVMLSTPGYRFCQYDLWNEEQDANGEPMLAILPKNLNADYQKKVITGETKGFMDIAEYQSLKRIDIHILKAENKNDSLIFKVELTNNSGKQVALKHISEPALALKQGELEISSKLLWNEQTQPFLDKNQKVIIDIRIPQNLFRKDDAVIFYTRSKENIRGEIISWKYIHPNS